VTDETGRSRDLERFITFIDAVTAIAITLLVLPLVDLVPELGTDGSVTALLGDHTAELTAFGLSFLVIARLWMSQHRVMSTVVVQDALVTRLLLAWTLSIVVLPFPTALVAQAGHQAATKIFYIGTMAMSSALLAALAWAGGRNRSIRDTDQRPDPLPALASVVGFAIALAITLAVPSTSYWPLLGMVLCDPFVHWWRGSRGSQPSHIRMGE